MVVSAILAFLASLGVVLLTWTVVGCFFLPAEGNGYTVLFADQTAARQIRAYLLLFGAGLLRTPLYVVDCGLCEEDCRKLRSAERDNVWIYLYSMEEWVQFRETERENGVLGA